MSDTKAKKAAPAVPPDTLPLQARELAEKIGGPRLASFGILPLEPGHGDVAAARGDAHLEPVFDESERFVEGPGEGFERVAFEADRLHSLAAERIHPPRRGVHRNPANP